MLLQRLCALALSGLLLPPAAHAADFLDVDDAFTPQAELRAAGPALHLHWRIAEGYALYRDRLHLSVDGQPLQPVMPPAQVKPDPDTGEPLQVYHRKLDVAVALPAGAHELRLDYQGCADEGLCYPPEQRVARLDGASPGPLALQQADPPAEAATTPAPVATVAVAAPPAADTDRASAVLRQGSAWQVTGLFLLFGLLLSFTPCVLPMVPILSSIIVGQKQATRGQGLRLAGAYALGMALVYTALGVAAGLAGEGLAGYLQQPAVLIGFAALLGLLSLSMFDVFTLQLPVALQTRLSAASDRAGGGALGGAAVMGALSALMVGPCVAAPLAGALLYIGQSHDVVLGGLALFSLAAGMSVPLLLAGMSADRLLPRAGAWMDRVKHVFGVVLIATAWWMVRSLLPASVAVAGWGLLALATAAFLGVFEPLPAHPGPGLRGLRTVALGLALFGALDLVGSAMGADDPMQPLAPLSRGSSLASASTATLPENSRGFRTVPDRAALQAALGQAQRPVLLDFYADWCVACKELERDTLHHPAVQQALGGFELLRVDVTDNSPEHRALLRQFGLFGPPGLVMFPRGDTQARDTVAGLLPPELMLARLCALSPQGCASR
ncbi:protein-disulfide reductase DsbD [Roseateles sp. BYS78W]|uniref:Protein-disulfide reductase DsbD n=1 Tax=Pelomonas candidula TaxID=3299025 RepID=A0ABW7H8S7_9BURK